VATGYTDKTTVENDRSGTTFTITGRDQLGRVADCGIDPWNGVYKFTDTMTFGQLAAAVLAPYNLTEIYTTDAYNRLITCGALADSPTQTTTITVTVPSTALSEDPDQPLSNQEYSVTQHVDPSNVFDLTTQQLTTLKAVPKETKAQFLEKNAARFHCHMWASNDGLGVVIGQPDYTQAPLFTLNKWKDGGASEGTINNVLRSSLDINYAEMPAVIFAKALMGSGDSAITRSACCKVNEFIGYDSSGNVLPNVQGLINQYTSPGQSTPYIQVIPPNPKLFQYQPYFQPITNVPPCQVYIDETGHHSGTQDQLQSWVSRHMSHYQTTALVYHCKVDDHQQNGMVFKHNTIATVNDEAVGLVGVPMWIKKVHFTKNRHDGGHTELDLCPIGVVNLGETS
jgi:prophage tail gpP-like protein